uniref:Uncharacterized protein n=1 Tax=Anopheles christyi TaxID=43041 RepID=A0A182KJ04_9DIPT
MRSVILLGRGDVTFCRWEGTLWEIFIYIPPGGFAAEDPPLPNIARSCTYAVEVRYPVNITTTFDSSVWLRCEWVGKQWKGVRMVSLLPHLRGDLFVRHTDRGHQKPTDPNLCTHTALSLSLSVSLSLSLSLASLKTVQPHANWEVLDYCYYYHSRSS